MTTSYFRVTIGGALMGGEVWSVNPIFRPLASGITVTPEECQTAATAIAALTPGAALLSAMSSSATITKARVEARTADFALEGVGEASRVTPLPGSGGATKPNQTAVVLSLRTPFPGPSARGRAYWPGLALLQENSTGKIGAPQPQNIATAAAAYFAAIGDALTAAFPSGDTAGLCVYSRTQNSFHYVNSVWVGDTIDTQRRRRDALVETYSVAPFTP